ncbi:hypothetical protein BC940DRAFT_347803 [Gongronella butleri]|nr:hypothetical protein BC940DRAFT_347803 [Gongronella butleri]
MPPKVLHHDGIPEDPFEQALLKDAVKLMLQGFKKEVDEEVKRTTPFNENNPPKTPEEIEQYKAARKRAAQDPEVIRRAQTHRGPHGIVQWGFGKLPDDNFPGFGPSR